MAADKADALLLKYPRGSWGPKEADTLLPDGDAWHDPVA